MEGSYVPKRAKLGVPCMLASFVTYQRPQGLMQDCLEQWAKSQQYIFDTLIKTQIFSELYSDFLAFLFERKAVNDLFNF